MFPELQRVCHDQGIQLSDDQLRAFAHYRDALYDWNKNKNLTRIPLEQCEVRHFAESCLIAGDAAHGETLDIGTGPGLPAWPLACVCPNGQITALDSNGKMIEFLRSVPLSNLSVIEGRVENQTWEEQFSLVTGRALAPLPIQLEVSARPCTIGGAIIPFRTESDNLEPDCLEGLGLKIEAVRRHTLSDGVTRVLPVYRKVTPTPLPYPRPWAMIKKNPLS